MIKLSELFEVRKSKGLELNSLEETSNQKGVPFVSRTANNNGISAYVKDEGFDKFPKGSISVSLGGTVLEAFIQDNDYITGYHMACLIPKIDMTIEQKLFYSLCIRANKYKYNYGRQANRTLADLLVPALEELPKWFEEECEVLQKYADMNVKQSAVEKELSLYNRSPKDYIGLELDTSTWKEYDVEEIFNLIRGKRITKEFISENEGDIPVIAGGEFNQGILGYLSDKFKEEYVYIDKCLTVSAFGSTGSVLCHNYPCYIDDKAIALKLKNKESNIYVMLFLCALLQQEKFRYTYGRGVLVDRYNINPIKLPSKLVEGKYEVDYDFMEAYIKTLAYSGCLEEAIVK